MNDLVILTFHSVDEQASVISFSPRMFAQAMASLDASGYQVLDLAEVVEILQRKITVPRHTVVITFDDGYQTVYEHAFPILRQYHMPATVFLTTGREQATELNTTRLPALDCRAMLNWAEIREMLKSGINFGAHTLTHSDLSNLSTAEVENEIARSKDIIQQALGVPVSSFAYPFGRSDSRSRAIAKRLFACACTDELGFVHPGSDLHTLKRIDTYYMRSPRLFRIIDSQSFRYYIRTRNAPRRVRRAILRR